MKKKKSRLEQLKYIVESGKKHQFDINISNKDRQLKQITKEYEELLEDHASLQEMFKVVSGFSENAMAPIEVEPLLSSKDGEGTLIGIGADWHIFERVVPQQVNMLNEYNVKIAKASVERFFQGLKIWADIHRSRIKVNNLVLCMAGDLATNQLHEDQKEMNEGTLHEEIYTLIDWILGGLDFLSKEFKNIYVVTADGNHTRDGKKIQVANRSKHSAEWLLFKIVEKICLEKYKNIKFQVAESYLNYFSVYDKTIRLHHGDNLRYQGGVGGLTIPMNKAIAKWDEAKKSDLDIFGHWHSEIPPGRFLSSGSLLGYSPYAIKIKATYEPPMQSCVLLDKKRGLTSYHRIYVR